MDKCYICDIEVNDYNSVIFPERDLDSKLVFKYCFDCSDSLVDLFCRGNITKNILKRKIGLKNYKRY